MCRETAFRSSGIRRLRRCPAGIATTDATGPPCNNIRVTVYSNRRTGTAATPAGYYPRLPSNVRRTLFAEFERATETEGSEDQANARLCRNAVAGQYASESLRSADLVVVGRRGRALAGIITVFRPTQRHPHTGQPYCLPHELYLDVVCSYRHPPACGSRMLDRFVRGLREKEPGVWALRLYACLASRSIWKQRFGFVEAETRMLPGRHRRRCVYTDHGPRYYPHEDAYGWGRTWRMTLILS